MVGGDDPLYLKFWGGPIPSKTPICNRFSLVASQLYTHSKNSSIISNRKSTTRFPMSLRWTSYVAAPNLRAQKRKWPFSV